MNFQKHPSREMVELFNRKPYQGQSPEKAKIIFLSSDANYSPEISNHPFFDYILEYQRDGIAFWKKYGCHHPFLHPAYPFNKNTGGVPFHRNFSKIGLGPEHAEHICFLELLDIPTIGNKSENRELFYSLASSLHLQYIERLILSGGGKLFFVSSGVLQDLQKFKRLFPVFSWVDHDTGTKNRFVKDLGGNRVQEICHFSAYQIHSQIGQIRTTIDNWLTSS